MLTEAHGTLRQLQVATLYFNHVVVLCCYFFLLFCGGGVIIGSTLITTGGRLNKASLFVLRAGWMWCGVVARACIDDQ